MIGWKTRVKTWYEKSKRGWPSLKVTAGAVKNIQGHASLFRRLASLKRWKTTIDCLVPEAALRRQELPLSKRLNLLKWVERGKDAVLTQKAHKTTEGSSGSQQWQRNNILIRSQVMSPLICGAASLASNTSFEDRKFIISRIRWFMIMARSNVRLEICSQDLSSVIEFKSMVFQLGSKLKMLLFSKSRMLS